MTIIAYDGKTVAADKREVDSFGLVRTVTKIFHHDGLVAAITGEHSAGIEMYQWWRAGAKPKDFPSSARDDKATLIVIGSGSILIYTTGPHSVRQEEKQAAFGSGRDFGLAAMAFGKTAAEAVEFACRFQADCGNGIDVLEPKP
ncbi:MAG: hypothetical protein LBI48_11440 [Burkholderiaceae bacterium]|jgi:ATP-dependent protease HslVU (ClpYQ) peptidase subunit|nr:hypothetical protein [Burkholderiaceae bacterium]